VLTVGARAGDPRRRGRRALLVVALAVVAFVVCPDAPGFAASSPTKPSSSPAGNGGSAGSGGAEQQPSAATLAAQARAQALHLKLLEQQGDADAARSALDRASQAAAAALESYRAAVVEQQQAQLDSAQAQAALAQAQQDVDDQRSALGRWAFEAYVSGGPLQHSPALLTLLSEGTTDDIATAQAVVKSVGDGQARALEALEGAQQRQQAALAAANTAQQTADADAALATEAKAAADAAVAEHRGALQQAEQAVTTTRKATAGADGEAALLAAADAYAGGAGGAGGNGVTGPVGSCTGGDVAAFPNGRIPLSLLCPVWGAPGAYLRADAEYAFDRLSHAYAKAFGTPICVTDAYRSYPDQVRVAAERPGFAAKPGTSNHGWGTATDLCGGIESFGTGTHRWMLENAPLFGWFHPSWAEPTGSLPEPWHWEFGG
jgi:hypothetical protein